MAIRSKHGPCLELKGSPRFRSSWERNFYRFALRCYPGVSYETQVFRFPKPYRRQLDYKPDFFLTDQHGMGWIAEVKGWLDGPSKSKLQGFYKHFPEARGKLILVTVKANFKWVTKNLPLASIIDYTQLVNDMGALCEFE